jgi:hypothetical protein
MIAMGPPFLESHVSHPSQGRWQFNGCAAISSRLILFIQAPKQSEKWIAEIGFITRIDT